MVFDLIDVVGFVPVVDFVINEEELDIRDFVIEDLRMGPTIVIILTSEHRRLKLTFSQAEIVESNGTEAGSVVGGWLLSISRPEMFDIETGKDTVAFSLDFAKMGSWILSCTGAVADLQRRGDPSF